MHGVRYQTRDVSRAVAFYTTKLGLALKHQQGEAFAAVTCGGLDRLLSGAGSSGARPPSDGRQQEPGGWNRVVLDRLFLRIAVLVSGDVRTSQLTRPNGGPRVQFLRISEPENFRDVRKKTQLSRAITRRAREPVARAPESTDAPGCVAGRAIALAVTGRTRWLNETNESS